jgi:hypothetical protein
MMQSCRLFLMIVAAAACGGGYSTPGTGAAPAPATPSAAPAPMAKAVQLQPGTTRYLVYQDVNIKQDFTGLPTIDLRYGLYLTATISGPADSLGYATSFTVDSIKVDSGTQLPRRSTWPPRVVSGERSVDAKR